MPHPPPRRPHRAAALWIAALSLGAAACAAAPALRFEALAPTTITPDRDGSDDVARLSYRVSRTLVLTVTLTADDGAVHVVRGAALRQPRAAPYELLFGGVIDGRMLPDGTYAVRLEARPVDGGARLSVDGPPLTIRDADAEPPAIRGLTVRPARFTPNQDGLDDRVAISYALDEPAEVRLRIETADGGYVTDILADTDAATSPGDPGPHVYDYDAGVDADAPPPPDGDYVVVVEARDAAGNIAVERRPLAIAQGGQPRAAFIDDVRFSATRLPLGGTLVFTATVKNVGGTPIRTRGPAPGYVYDNDHTFNQPAERGFVLLARHGGRRGSLRVPAGAADVTIALAREAPLVDPSAGDAGGIDPEAGEGGAPSDGPQRLCGGVRDVGGDPAAGAEVFAFEADGDNGQRVVADAQGRFCFAALTVSPDHARTFARSPGALRLGFTYDDRRSDLDYPFRYQVGSTAALDACPADDIWYLCLMPGATVRVQGAVRFVEPPYRRTTQAYVALMHEDVRVMHGPYGVQALSIEYDTPRAP